MAHPRAKAHFVEPMLLQRADMLPSGLDWVYELKLDGFQAEAIKGGGTARRSRNDKEFNARFPSVVEALAAMPDETVIDGEIVALDESGRPSFNALQNYGAGAALIIYYVFDGMVVAGKDVMGEPLATRRNILRRRVLAKLGEPIRESPELNASLPDLIRSVKAQSLEGPVAKRRDSRYEPGQRSGAWQKMRISQGQDFVIAGYTPGSKNFHAIIFGYYDAGTLMYAGRTRNGFTPSSRHQLFKRFNGLEVEKCPFGNLPETKSGRWGEGLTAEKMKDCRWLEPVLVGQFEYVEWTPDAHLRHSRFMGLRDDKAPRDVR